MGRKIYISHNMDGTNQAAVIARNLKEAAQRLRISVYQLRQFGWSNLENEELWCLLSHGQIAWKPIDDYTNDCKWRAARWTRDEIEQAKLKRRISGSPRKDPATGDSGT